MMYLLRMGSPVGPLYIVSDGEAITGLWLEGQKYFASTLHDAPVESRDLPVLCQAESWLNSYFKKAPLPSLPPLRPEGSPFRQEVWNMLLAIPYGQTTTYGAIAAALKARGVAAAPQAVGGAVGHNPISILIPCHRVVGANGSLTGYAGGVKKKAFLLDLEGAHMASFFVPKRGSTL